MIKYNLKCDLNHVFEAWFKNSSAYDEQNEKGIVSCSLCGSTNIVKAPMAPSIPKKGNRKAPEVSTQKQSEEMAVAMKALRELRKNVEENCDYVGENFAEEARKIHYGETEERGIYGQATKEEQQELIEEGVEIAAVPWLSNQDG
ncbi:DUF1178 family protein [Sneathiella sp. P13V-1]|uniref:DUF1178 family protein n=1 Tax=Sneathiella sp. P13V-1 TaxID=2697366 RepID=UPI00187B91C5|nr:DUF1178 family protein [Sneathiella sp. P13V-1]MBE7636550.1 DUF1178 family protein [Sneathiella sp. P13V-1]